MKKDILDELEVKNSGIVSEKNFNDNTVLGINKDLEKLRINDDVSNEDIISNEYSSVINNSYVELNEVVKDKNNSIIDDKNKVYVHPIIPNKQWWGSF